LVGRKLPGCLSDESSTPQRERIKEEDIPASAYI
jgi:hypothetical protein